MLLIFIMIVIISLGCVILLIKSSFSVLISVIALGIQRVNFLWFYVKTYVI